MSKSIRRAQLLNSLSEKVLFYLDRTLSGTSCSQLC
ncbi:unnamed protein product [Haemonchus placei]|uniref:Uncharacterized protein n=1 Tax=Haemonchus placei TaxID=6290 RepID=A0A0N4VX03_HAEPC|nr:unnamed protein product [Haemonchus placei]